MSSSPYNPLDKWNFAKSIESEILGRSPNPLGGTDHIEGAGVYVLYYQGDFPSYAPIAAANQNELSRPIYVGKAIPKGGRKGGLTRDASTGRARRSIATTCVISRGSRES